MPNGAAAATLITAVATLGDSTVVDCTVTPGPNENRVFVGANCVLADATTRTVTPVAPRAADPPSVKRPAMIANGGPSVT
jgi:hypothetical protein